MYNFKLNASQNSHYKTPIYTVSQNRCHPNHNGNFVISWSIWKILSLQQRALNFKQNHFTHHSLSMLLHYPEKRKK